MNRLFYFLILLFVAFGCGKDEPEKIDPPVIDPLGQGHEPGYDPKEVERTVVVYAVNRSSLGYDFEDDMSEMLSAMEQIKSDKYQLLVYKTSSASQSGLYRVVKDASGKADIEEVRLFYRDVTSTHPDRIKDVIDYALTLYPESAYDLIFWGHGMSWKPYFSNHEVIEQPMLYGYGGEYNQTGNPNKTDWTEIDELADAVPDHKFDTIWFDCCYMSGIEVIYEFRDKCKTFVGYPSEVWQEGLAYDKVLPYLLKERPDITGGAKAFYDYYAQRNEPVTVAVVDMAGIDGVAETARNIIKSGETRPDAKVLLNYSRTKSSPFYDFAQFFSLTADLNNCPDLASDFQKALDTAVIYHAESDRDFNKKPWDRSSISGISTHFYKGLDTRDESYYRTLDWYKRVY